MFNRIKAWFRSIPKISILRVQRVLLYISAFFFTAVAVNATSGMEAYMDICTVIYAMGCLSGMIFNMASDVSVTIRKLKRKAAAATQEVAE